MELTDEYMTMEKAQKIIEYYEGLLDFLDDHVSCLDELIGLYEEEYV